MHTRQVLIMEVKKQLYTGVIISTPSPGWVSAFTSTVNAGTMPGIGISRLLSIFQLCHLANQSHVAWKKSSEGVEYPNTPCSALRLMASWMGCAALKSMSATQSGMVDGGKSGRASHLTELEPLRSTISSKLYSMLRCLLFRVAYDGEF